MLLLRVLSYSHLFEDDFIFLVILVPLLPTPVPELELIQEHSLYPGHSSELHENSLNIQLDVKLLS